MSAKDNNIREDIRAQALADTLAKRVKEAEEADNVLRVPRPIVRVVNDVKTPEVKVQVDNEVKTPNVNVTNEVKTPNVRVTNEVKSPEVKVTNEVKTPNVNVTNEVKTPEVNVVIDMSEVAAAIKSMAARMTTLENLVVAMAKNRQRTGKIEHADGTTSTITITEM